MVCDKSAHLDSFGVCVRQNHNPKIVLFAQATSKKVNLRETPLTFSKEASFGLNQNLLAKNGLTLAFCA